MPQIHYNVNIIIVIIIIIIIIIIIVIITIIKSIYIILTTIEKSYHTEFITWVFHSLKPILNYSNNHGY